MPSKRTWILIAIAVSGYLIGPLIGRFTAPTKVVTEVKTEYQEKVVEKEVVKWKTETVYVQAKAAQTRIVEVKKPDGTQVTVTETKTQETAQQTLQEAHVTSRTNEVTQDHAQVAKKTETRQSPNTLVLMGGIGLDLTPSYGAAYTRQFIGPIGVGVWYIRSDDHRAGIAASISF